MASVFRRQRSPYWWAAVTLPGGKRRQFSTKLTDEGEALEMAIRTEGAAKRHRNATHLRQTLNRLVSDITGIEEVKPKDWLNGWLEGRKGEVEESTVASYAPAITEAGEFFESIGREALADISVADATALRSKWASVNGATTTNFKMKVLRSALKDALQLHLVAENVALSVSRLKAAKGGSKRRDLTLAELQAVLKAADKTWRAMTLLGLFTGGQRMGDLATLQRRDIQWAAKIISTEARKTGAPIILPIVPALAKALEELPLPMGPDDYLFPELAGLTKAGRSKRFRRVLYEAGLVPKRTDQKPTGKGLATRRRKTSELSFHSLRHTATTMLKAAGVSDGVTRSIVGHESAAVSKVYTHIPMDTMRAALNKIKIPQAS